MIISVFAYSRQGCETARRVLGLLTEESCQGYTMEKFQQPDFLPLGKRNFYGDQFSQADALIFIGSCGIAVRQIAPYVRDKKTDPAVLCIDELGKFVIPILSGHIGGANALTQQLAAELGAVPVVTTATDINGKFSVDAWAARNGYAISSMTLAKAVSARILEQSVPLKSDFPIRSELPPGVVAADQGELGILLSWKTEEPFRQTLRLIPKVLHLGIGCRKGTPKEAIEAAVDQVLSQNAIDSRAIGCAASIDLKAQEQGLLEFCRERALPVTFYTAQELREVPGMFTKSQFVSSITGVDNVCERAAMVGAKTLLVRKTACSGVTVAVAVEQREVYFGQSSCCGHWPRKL